VVCTHLHLVPEHAAYTRAPSCKDTTGTLERSSGGSEPRHPTPTRGHAIRNDFCDTASGKLALHTSPMGSTLNTAGAMS
jgi:hypothetical protein